MPKKLTDKEILFCKEYVASAKLNATQAAINAGYSEKTARQIGYENLTKPYIVDYIQQLMEEREKRLEVSADRVVKELACIGFVDPKDLYDENGNLLPVHKLPENIRRAIANIKISSLGGGEGEDAKPIILKQELKLIDKRGGLELLGRHLAMWKDQLNIKPPVKDWDGDNKSAEDFVNDAITQSKR